jgi:probable HAF family extracellular repeat protein
MKHAMFLGAVGLALCVVTNAAAANSITYTVGGLQVTLTDLGVLPGGTFSSGLAINNRGEAAGYANVLGTVTWEDVRPIWNASTGAIIGMADNWDPASTAIPEFRNDNGEMVGTEVIFSGNLSRGVYWNSAGQAFGLPGLPWRDPSFGPVHVLGHGINNLGQMVGGAKDGTEAPIGLPSHPMHAVLWQSKDASPQDLGFLGKGTYVDYSEALGVNDSTHVVGVGAVGSVIRGFLWRNGTMVDLGALSGQVTSEAYAINNNGLIAGKSNFYPVIWRYDVANASSVPTIQQLPIPPGFFSAQPTSVNASGDVAGYAGSPSIDAHAVLWRNGQAIDLGIWPGGTYSVANGINNLGQIVGTGTVAGDNLDHALVWTVAVVSGGGGGTNTTTSNKTPSATLQSTSPTSIRAGGSLSVRASFTDPDNGPWSYRLDWGDGTVTMGNTSAAGTISGINPHVYSTAGSFKAKLTVTDRKGAAGSSTAVTVKVR